ncbi:hypothetical protein Q8A67_006520 [Cirrhinus molitorella]|uniref:Uncharacterized protein n=1 Tax=Cirrhinus molitorella TaxID=172907 RepID=A0AA88TSW2_9TELE|nr:hypothetical protein Q8A67_006520 [Cirrhinus molitorella]
MAALEEVQTLTDKPEGGQLEVLAEAGFVLSARPSGKEQDSKADDSSPRIKFSQDFKVHQERTSLMETRSLPVTGIHHILCRVLRLDSNQSSRATEAVCASSQLPSQTCSSPQPAVPLCPLSARRQCPRYRSKRSASVFIQPWVQRSNPEAGTFPDTCSFTASYQSTV